MLNFWFNSIHWPGQVANYSHLEPYLYSEPKLGSRCCLWNTGSEVGLIVGNLTHKTGHKQHRRKHGWVYTQFYDQGMGTGVLPWCNSWWPDKIKSKKYQGEYEIPFPWMIGQQPKCVDEVGIIRRGASLNIQINAELKDNVTLIQ